MFGFVNAVIVCIIYISAACGMAFSGWYLYWDIKYMAKMLYKLCVEENPFLNRIAKSYEYKTVFLHIRRCFFNLIFTAGNGLFGITNHSVWFGTMSAYYTDGYVCVFWSPGSIRTTKNKSVMGTVICMKILIMGISLAIIAGKKQSCKKYIYNMSKPLQSLLT